MNKVKIVTARNAGTLAHLLNLSPDDGVEMEVRRRLNDKIIQAVSHSGLTHAQVAKLCGTSRTRITAIMNRNTKDISTDLLLRVLYSLGYTAKIKFQKAA